MCGMSERAVARDLERTLQRKLLESSVEWTALSFRPSRI